MIEVIIGTMKSEKTSTLIEKVDYLKEVGKSVTVFYPAHCNKVDGYVYSRKNNRTAKAKKVFNISDLYNNIDNTDAILIDETQFIVSSNNIDDFMRFLEFVDSKNIDIFLVGLQLDYMSNSFEIIQRILPYADKVEILSAKCEECGDEHATRCIRYNGDKMDCDPNSSLLLMENDKTYYKSVCRKCYRKITGLSAIK